MGLRLGTCNTSPALSWCIGVFSVLLVYGFSKTHDVKAGFTGLQDPISKLMIGGAGAQVSREPPPPLPGDYVVGEQVYFTGTGETLASGNRLEHGKQGEVMGPATDESFRGKGVKVRFPGNKDAISCYLTEVRRRCAQPPTAPRRPCCLSSRSPSHTTSAVWAHR